ncbi:MAG: PSD1 and planctomycete cytochrome C domain-containing protein, partial [Pirellulales bacterium]
MLCCRMKRLGAAVGILWAALCASSAFSEESLNFEQHVRPILKAWCFDCHGGDEKLSGNLDLRLRRFALRGGDSGPSIAPGDADASLLWQRVSSGEMPPGEKKVSAEDLDILRRWIAAGAPTRREEPEQLSPGVDITPEEREFWSFQPVPSIEPPRLADTVAAEAELAGQPGADLVRTPIDSFVLARLREQGARFSPDADRLTLIRRASFDLTGLPPTTAEIEAFLADTSDNAYEQLLDRLLASPHYGERWGRHWLDVAGYADSEGNGSDDTPRPYLYKYRDYVIRALNADKPLDQFIIEQLAGDELVPQPWNNLTPDQIDTLAATGFLRTAVDPTATGGADELAGANQVVADTIKIVSTSLMGLSVGCAQCHDHKYDPIPQADYFRLRAVLAPALDTSHWRRSGQRLISLYTDADRAKAAEIDAQVQAMRAEYDIKANKYLLAAFEKELLKFPEDQRQPLREAYTTPADKRTPEQKQLLDSNPKVNLSHGVLYQYDEAADKELKADQDTINKKNAERPVEDYVSLLNELPGVLPPTMIFHRGDYRQPTKAVQPGDLTIAAPSGQRLELAENDPALATSGRRLAFARHLTNGQHPLFGRVIANRIWLHHLGRGIVGTPADFGVLGLRPTHPQLLDWLAGELPRNGWSLKKFHKTIMLSTTYRQSSVGAADRQGSDAENHFYSRFPLLRLEAETLRDRMLAASGQLDAKMFGPPVPVIEDFVGQVIPQDDSPRRSIYLQVRRSKPVSFLSAFDAPLMTVNCELRVPSTGAPQALMLMNNDFVLKQAALLAGRLKRETPAGYAAATVGPVAARFPRHAEVWQYGYGEFNAESQRMAAFTPLPYYTGSAWQGGEALPDAVTGWAIQHAAGGHAGNDQQHASIRRFVSPAAGLLTISSKLRHNSESGDGVRARIVSSRAGLLGEWPVINQEIAGDVPPLEVAVGESIDFVIDCQGDVNCDSFGWTVDVKLTDAAGSPLDTWNSASDFHGPPEMPLAAYIAYGWQVAFQRPATSEELVAACQFVAEQMSHLRA